MDFISERPNSFVVEQILLYDNNYNVPMIAGPCPGKTYDNPTIDNCYPFYTNSIIGNPLNFDGFYTGWYCYSANEIENLIHPRLLSSKQCGFCYNCIRFHRDSSMGCMNSKTCIVDIYKNWFDMISEIIESELYTTPISSPRDSIITSPFGSPRDSIISSGRGTPDSDSIWLFH
jgi:hypothetical protein